MPYNNLNPPPQGTLIPGSSQYKDVSSSGLLKAAWPYSNITVKGGEVIDFTRRTVNSIEVVLTETNLIEFLNISIGFSTTLKLTVTDSTNKLTIKTSGYSDLTDLEEGTYFIVLYSSGLKYTKTTNPI